MKLYFRPPDSNRTIDFEVPEGSVCVQINGDCPTCRGHVTPAIVTAIDLENNLFYCSESQDCPTVIPERAFHMARVETLDGWAPRFYREES